MGRDCVEVNVGTGGTVKTFKTPLLPYLPCCAIIINWFLIAQLELYAILMLLVYVSLWAAVYFCYGIKNSVGNNGGWAGENGVEMDKVGGEGEEDELNETEQDNDSIKLLTDNSI